MLNRCRRLIPLGFLLVTALNVSFAQQLDVKAVLVSRIKNSEAFTLKVADAMPAADYGYKLTPEQNTFGWQMEHLSQGMAYFMSVFSGTKPHPGKPASDSKADVMAFMKQSFEKTIEQVSALTPEQMAKTYKGGETSSTGLEMLIAMLEHNAHHRACGEMYLRAKGIKPPAYMD